MVYNLNGGVLNTPIVKAPADGANSAFNFNGGTLKAGTASTTFMSGLSSAIVYSGGATIDDGGNTITIGQPSTPQRATAWGPWARSYAQQRRGRATSTRRTSLSVRPRRQAGHRLRDINATGPVADIVITSPGSGYTSGQDRRRHAGRRRGRIGAAFSDLTASAANTSGGLTKTGSGMLTLTGANTYSGNTFISSGTLALGNGLALQQSSWTPAAPEA